MLSYRAGQGEFAVQSCNWVNWNSLAYIYFFKLEGAGEMCVICYSDCYQF